MKARGFEVNIIPAYENGFDFYSDVFFVHEEMLQKQPEVLQKFLEVTFRGWREAFTDPVGTAKLVVDRYFPDGDLAHQTEELKLIQFIATLGVGEKLMGVMGDLVWEKGVDVMTRFGQIDRKVPVEELYTMELLKNIYATNK